MKLRPTFSSASLYWSILVGLLLLQLMVLTFVIRSLGIGLPLLYGARKLGLRFAMLIGCALMIRIVSARFRGDSMRAAATSVLEKWWEFPLILVAYILLAQVYMWGKVFVPVINTRLWDSQLALLDHFLFFGVNPNIVVITILEGSSRLLWRGIDLFYGAFVPMMLGVTAFLVTDRPSRRKGFLSAMVILWSLGLWLYIAVPALGPAFVDGAFGREISGVFPIAAQMQRLLIQQYTQVPGILQSAGLQLSPTLGVAAMPSLHVGAQVLFFLWLYQSRSSWRIVFLMVALLTWIASVATGWHWAVDGIVGGLLATVAAWAGWKIALRMEALEIVEPEMEYVSKSKA